MGEKAPQEIRERVWVEKIDKTGDEPRLVETVFVQQTRTLQPDGTMAVETTRELPEESS